MSSKSECKLGFALPGTLEMRLGGGCELRHQESIARCAPPTRGGMARTPHTTELLRDGASSTPESPRAVRHARNRLPCRVSVSISDIFSTMPRSFCCKDTMQLAAGRRARRFVAIERVARRKLAQLDAAATMDFPGAPPGSRLEALGELLHGLEPGHRTRHANVGGRSRYATNPQDRSTETCSGVAAGRCSFRGGRAAARCTGSSGSVGYSEALE